MQFEAASYGEKVAQLLSLDEDGNRLMPLVATKSSASHLCNDGALDPPGRSRRLWIQKLKTEII